MPLYRGFAGPNGGTTRLPDESTILRFRHLLETHGLAAQILALVNEILCEKGLMLKAGSVVDATLISAPSSTKNDSGTRGPEMHRTEKGNQWYFGTKAHVGIDAESGLVHTVIRHRRPMSRTSMQPRRCCTVRKPMCTPTPDIGA